MGGQVGKQRRRTVWHARRARVLRTRRVWHGLGVRRARTRPSCPGRYVRNALDRACRAAYSLWRCSGQHLCTQRSPALAAA